MPFQHLPPTLTHKVSALAAMFYLFVLTQKKRPTEQNLHTRGPKIDNHSGKEGEHKHLLFSNLAAQLHT